MNNQHFEALNHLIHINNDAADGFSRAAEYISHPQIKPFLAEQASQRKVFKDEIAEIITKHYQEAEQGSTVNRDFIGGWNNLRSGVTLDDANILKECVSGENDGIEAYKNALQLNDWPENVSALLELQQEYIVNNYEVLSALEFEREKAQITFSTYRYKR